MEYLRQNLEFSSAGTACRARGMLRAEVRDQALKIRIQLEGVTPAPYGTYHAEMICVRDGRYRKYALGTVRTDARGHGELLYRCALGGSGVGPRPEDYQVFRVQKGYPDPTDLLTARVENAARWQELEEWQEHSASKAEKTPPALLVSAPEPIPEEVSEAIEAPRVQAPLQEKTEDEGENMMRHMPEILPFYQSRQKWVRVDPGDLSPLPCNLTELENSAFVMRAYTRYKHLVLSKEGKEYQLGIPGRYIPEMAQEAAAEQCHEFRAAHGQSPKRGDFGYWIRRISGPEA